MDKYFEYPEFTEMLQPGYYLVIAMLGGNDVSAETDAGELWAKKKKKKTA